ncbi:MAG: hypothetical protein HZC17_01595 [Candidatus Omnitrophica bacterium]|nr:hypothetical protein [Candidatus Omnitrophota bacterium]
MTGYIEANSVVNQNGHILLVAHSGLVRSAGEIHADGSSSNPNGGLVDVLGDKIIQRGFISANALDGGVAGNINVIADTGTLLTDLSHIEARGVSGISHGGVVVVNSLAGSTDFRQFSDINVSGGPVGGDAGFIEVSAKENLNFSGKVYGVAQPGYAGGSILLDPQDITISNAGGNAVAGGNSAPGTADETFAENGAGTNVTYDPRAGGAFNGFNEIFLQASRDIIINSPFSVPTAVGAGGGPNLSLRLEANRHINVNANVSTTTGNITFKADADNSTSGNFTQAAGVSISSTSGNISISGRGTQTVGNISTGGAGTIGITSNNGAVTQRNGTTLQTAGGNVTITAQNGDATVEIINANGGNITVTANGGNDIVRQSAANLLTGNIVTLSANTANGTVGTAAQPINTNATIINASARQTGIFITESDGATLNNITTTNDNIVIISTTGNLSVGTVNAGTANVTLTATAGSILDATSAITGNTVTLTAGGAAGSLGVSATPINTTATTLALTSGSGGAFISNTGSVTLNAPTIGAGGSISVVSSGTLMLPGTALSLGAGNINFASNGGNLTTAANLTTSTGNITLSASGILTVANNLQATGAGNIGLTADNNGAGGESLVWNAGNTIMSAGGNVNLTVGNGATGTGNVNLRTANAGAGNITVISREGSIVEAASGSSSLTGATVTLTSGTGAGDAVGTLVDAINTTATTINATSGTGGIFIDETNAVTLNSITTAGGNVKISGGGNMTLGTVSGGFVSLTTTAGGSILDGNGVANNLTATAGASLTSAGIIGTGTDPLEVNVTGGNLTVAAGGNDLATGISVNINGTVTPSNTLTVSVRPAGRVFFNGVDLFATNTILEITIDGNVIFVNLQERFRSRDEAKDLLSATSDPFVDKKRWTLAPRSQYLKQEYQP